jgi:hypothetical protein
MKFIEAKIREYGHMHTTFVKKSLLLWSKVAKNNRTGQFV